MKKTLYKYIVSEIVPNFLSALFVSVFIIVSIRMLSITELVINQGVSGIHVFQMVVYLLPDIILFALPAAGLIAVVLAFMRLSADSEIIALKTSGIGLYQMMPPVVILSFVWMTVSLMIAMLAVPWGNRQFKDLAFTIAESKADIAIKERIFCEPFDDVVFYVSSFSSSTRVMSDVFVVDRRNELSRSTIVAKMGKVISHPEERAITLHFESGTIFRVGKDLESARSIQFRSYDLNIGLEDIMKALAEREKDPKEMNLTELRKKLHDVSKDDPLYNEVLVELLEKISIPLAVFFMGIIGVPLGSHMKPRGRSVGISVSLIIFFLYYAFLAAMKSICETGALSPKIGIWLPTLFLLTACIFFLKVSAQERSLDILEGLSGLWRFIKFRLLKQNKISFNQETVINNRVMTLVEKNENSVIPEMKAREKYETAVGPGNARNFVGNKRLKRLHRPECGWAKKISKENMIEFESKEEAFSQGFEPCKLCKP